MRVKTGDRAVQKRKRLMKRAQDRVTIMDKRRASMPQKKSKGGKIMKAMGGKMMKSKGYSKGGARMMKAMGGKMASKGGTRMMKAMGGKMAKGYAKGGAKMIRAQKGKEIKRPKIMISDVRNMKMTQRQKQLVGAGGASKLASMINKLPKSGKLALAGGLTAGTIALISKLNPGASRAGKQLREMKKKKIQEMKKKK